MDGADSQKSLQVRRNFWRQQVVSWKESGLSQAEYCRRHKLDPSRFSYWRRRFLSRVILPVAQVTFCSGNGLKLVIDDRYRVEIGDCFSPDALRQLLQVLEDR